MLPFGPPENHLAVNAVEVAINKFVTLNVNGITNRARANGWGRTILRIDVKDQPQKR